ncbi:hybrid sensor histidine kinase/response regulator [uncultured Sphingomonas sp.]|uniref:hybrid sensor histidine kinase/response regulator n=1 Tax=uncultured Sphingomonas sp. TaxID=158754 RepID=UPI0025E60F73|nr:hybrid sensor histidine kinase/response regulator [uncultured Sphingomonas sp.]
MMAVETGGGGSAAQDRRPPETGAGCGWNWDIAGERLYTDAAFADLHGLDAEEAARGLPTAAFFTAIHADDRARMRIAVAGMVAGSETFSKEFRIVAANGSVRWMHGRGRTEFDAQDAPVRFTGFLVDVTDRKRTEERLRIAQSAGGVGTFEYVDGFATVSVSDAFCRLLGLHPASVLPVRTINAVVAPDGDPLIPDVEPAALEGDFRIRRPDTDEERWIARRGEVVRDRAGSGYRLIGVIYDITAGKRQQDELRAWAETLEARVEQAVAERRQVEDALRQAQKMEAVGHLTGGIAHDFNNLLAGISGSLEMMQIRLAQGRLPDLERYMTAAQGATRRAAALTHRLLAFSRRQTLTPSSTDVNKLVHGMEDLIRRTVGPEVALETIGAAGLWRTLVDGNQLENALLNLCINARDAMPDGGRLTIETSNGWMDRRAAAARDLDPGQYVKLCVSDTGTGMAKEVIERAFDPFFTTKPIGQGTGLGLSMIYGFARQSGGQVRIYSEVGEGTMVCIYLPRHLGDDEPAADQDRPVDLARALAGETVLVVDDEPTVRMLVVDALEDLGYAAIEAADGPEGLRILQSGARIDLLVTDVGLPGGMNGRQLAEAARAVRDDLKVLFITGYAENAVLNHGHLDHGMEVLTKPFSMDALAQRIRTLIEDRR